MLRSATALMTLALAGLGPISLHSLRGRIAPHLQGPIRLSNAEPRLPAVRLSLTYTNTQYGFTVKLPDSWKGYTIVEMRWVGQMFSADGTSTPSDTASGPQVSIRHPAWSESQPRQDIPIMIFTRAQWRLVTRVELVVSAAPFGPQALARNPRYVFALPPRYDFAELPGTDEVRDILAHDPLRPL